MAAVMEVVLWNLYLPGIRSLFFSLHFNLTPAESQSVNLHSLSMLHTFLKHLLTHNKASLQILTISPQKQSFSPGKGGRLLFY